MADRTVNGLSASIKALKEVVAPAVDAGNPFANEQLRLVCGYLALVCDRLAYRNQRQRFELLHWLRLGSALVETARECFPDIESVLIRAIDEATALDGQAAAAEADLQAATRALGAAISTLVRAAPDTPEPTRRFIERAVLDASQEWLDVQRAWYAPLGFDAEARSLAPIDSALRQASHPASR